MKERLKRTFLVAAFVLFTILVSFFSYYEYDQIKTKLYHQIDERLIAAASGSAVVLSNDFFDRATEAHSVLPAEDLKNIDHLSQFAATQHVQYVYTMIRKEGKIRFISSSATADERRTGTNLTRYFDVYDDASPELYRAFETGKPQFSEYTDKWGTFRSVFIPMKTLCGTRYVTAADVKIDTIRTEIWQETAGLLMRGFGLMTVGFLLFAWRLIQINRNLRLENKDLGEEIVATISEKELSDAHVYHLTHFDTLTGLANRQKLHFDISEKEPFGCAIFNIDNFKEINDFFGIETGDELLRQIAQWFLRSGFSPYRLGGDEFVLLFPQPSTQEHLLDRLNNLLYALGEERFIVDEETLDIQMSVGVATGGGRLLTRADIALHNAKERKIPISFYEISEKIEERYRQNIQMAGSIRKALLEGRIFCHYQPIANVLTGRIDKYEALARMEDEEGNIVPPGVFLPIAKKTKLYPRITQEVVHQACRAFASRDEEFSINLSLSDILDPVTVHDILSTLTKTGTASRAVFEILESERIEAFPEVAKFLTTLKEMGAKVAIDDFGTGYSNFEHLLNLHVDYIKIDGSLIGGIEHNERHRIIVETIVAFASRIEARCIAEYVSEAGILDAVKAMKIDYAQGFYIGKPKPLE